MSKSIAQHLDGTIIEPNFIISEETSTMYKIVKIQMRKSDGHISIEWEV